MLFRSYHFCGDKSKTKSITIKWGGAELNGQMDGIVPSQYKTWGPKIRCQLLKVKAIYDFKPKRPNKYLFWPITENRSTLLTRKSLTIASLVSRKILSDLKRSACNSKNIQKLKFGLKNTPEQRRRTVEKYLDIIQGCHFPDNMKFPDFSRPRLSSNVIPRPFRGVRGHALLENF